jgi:hypothetical protein
MGMSPAIRQRLPQLRQRQCQAQHWQWPKRFLLRLPPPCGVMLALRWRRRTPGSAYYRRGDAFGSPSSSWGSGGGNVANGYCRLKGGDTIGCTVGGRCGRHVQLCPTAKSGGYPQATAPIWRRT